MNEVKYLVSGDCAVCVEFGNEISPEINRKIRAFKLAVENEAIEGIVEKIGRASCRERVCDLV